MELHQHGNGMYSPVSSTSSSGSGTSDSDEFGLRTLRCFYSPYLVSELERLFVSSPLEQANMNGSQVKSVWDDFENNGQETELDELDRLFRGMDVGELCRKTAPEVTAAVDVSGIQKASSAVEDILTKASLIEILRERERLQRSRTKKLQKKPNANKVCVFCRNNGEAETVYTSHQLKDPEGNITCPILYIYTCPICGANGKSAHTIKYCPYNTGESLSTISTLSKAIRPVLPKHIVPLI